MTNDRRIPSDHRSMVAGATDEPLSSHTVSSLLRETAGRFPDREAAVFCEHHERWSYREFDEHVDQLAA